MPTRLDISFLFDKKPLVIECYTYAVKHPYLLSDGMVYAYVDSIFI